MENGPLQNVFTSENGDIPASYVSLPEGRSQFFVNLNFFYVFCSPSTNPCLSGVHQPLPHTGQPPAVHSLQLDKVAKTQGMNATIWYGGWWLYSWATSASSMEIFVYIGFSCLVWVVGASNPNEQWKKTWLFRVYTGFYHSVIYRDIRIIITHDKDFY